MTNALWVTMAWHLRREGFRNVPQSLNQKTPYWKQWSSPRLLVSQACGYDVMDRRGRILQPVATPIYSAPGCLGGTYSSIVVVREEAPFETLEDLRGHRCVINTPNSHSGMNILRALVAPLHVEGRFFSRVRVSGAHMNSLSMIQNRQAEVAAIDCVTHALLTRFRPKAIEGTRIICQSLRYPAPPYVTGWRTSKEEISRMQTAILETFEETALSDVKEALFLDRAEILESVAYRAIADLEKWTLDHGYTEFNRAWRLGWKRGAVVADNRSATVNGTG